MHSSLPCLRVGEMTLTLSQPFRRVLSEEVEVEMACKVLLLLVIFKIFCLVKQLKESHAFLEK